MSRNLLTGFLAAMLIGPHAMAAACYADGPPPRLSIAPSAALSGERGLRTAVLNVQVYVDQRRTGTSLARLLENVETMPLLEAASSIATLEHDRRGLHHRLALLDLLGWVERGIADDREQAEVRRAVEQLVGGERAARLYAALSRPRGAAACDAPDWEHEQRALNALLEREVGPVVYKSCTDVEAVLASVFDVGDHDVGVVSKVIATAPLAGAQKGLDAQHWSHCAPELWDQSFLVKLDSNGNAEGNGSCSIPNDPGCMPNQGTSRPWDVSYDTDAPLPKRPLFERFVCDGGWCDVRILLHIVTTVDSAASPPDAAYRLEYKDPEPWKGFAFAKPDRGDVVVQSEDLPTGLERLTVEANKTFGFESWATNAAIAFMLKRIQMGRYLADLVCCNP